MENDDLYTKLPFCIYEIEKFIFYIYKIITFSFLKDSTAIIFAVETL